MPVIEDADGERHLSESSIPPRPPRGCMPETLYEEQRLRHLARAINDYVQGGFFGGEYAVTVGTWCDELSRRLKAFR